MPMLNYTIRSLQAAFRLGLLDRSALGRLDLTVDGFWRSFGAVLIALPLIGAAVAMQKTGAVVPEGGIQISTFGSLAISALAWGSYLLLILPLSRHLKLDDHYVSYVVAYNWAQAVVSIAFFVLSFLAAAGILNAAAMAVLSLALHIAVLVYMWAVARLALNASALASVAFVVLDDVLSVVFWQILVVI